MSVKDGFADAVEAYNEENKPPIPLSIAYGMSEMKCGEDSPEDVEKKADKRMYEHKLRIKKQESTETVG